MYTSQQLSYNVRWLFCCRFSFTLESHTGKDRVMSVMAPDESTRLRGEGTDAHRQKRETELKIWSCRGSYSCSTVLIICAHLGKCRYTHDYCIWKLEGNDDPRELQNTKIECIVIPRKMCVCALTCTFYFTCVFYSLEVCGTYLQKIANFVCIVNTRRCRTWPQHQACLM